MPTPYSPPFRLAAAVLLAAVFGTAVAQTPAPAAPPATQRLDPPSTGMASMAQLDLNHDGFIDKSEVPAGNELAGKFARLDQNSDGKLDAEEFARYQQETR